MGARKKAKAKLPQSSPKAKKAALKRTQETRSKVVVKLPGKSSTETNSRFSITVPPSYGELLNGIKDQYP